MCYFFATYLCVGCKELFGIDFDPLTGKLWDTENGPNYGDEINLVEAGFNRIYFVSLLNLGLTAAGYVNLLKEE
jgi:hypothetical protein